MIAAIAPLLFLRQSPPGVEVKADRTLESNQVQNKSVSYTIGKGDVPFCIDVKIEFFDTGKTEWHTADSCGPRCRGKYFPSHKDCDGSCDLPCGRIHQGSLHVEGNWRYPVLDQCKQQVLADIKKFGGKEESVNGFPWNDAWFPKLDHELYEYNLNHWSKGRCELSYLMAEYESYHEDLTYTLWRTESGVRVNGPTYSRTIALVDVPTGNMIETDPSSGYCLCNLKASPIPLFFGRPFPTDDGGQFGNFPKYGGTAPGGSGIKLGLNPDAPFGTYPDFKQYNLTFKCSDVITANVDAPTWTDGPDGFRIPPGTILEADDDDYQDMIVLDDMMLLRDPNVVAPQDPGKPKIIVIGRKNVLVGAGHVSGYADCIEMHKKQPDSSVSYHEILSNSPQLDRLAYMASKELIRGPWIQTRFWIYTDNATYDDIAQVLLPAPTKTQYISALYTVATAAGVDLLHSSQKRCLDIHQLSWGEPSDAEIHWLVETLSKQDPKAVADYVEKNQHAFDYLFQPGANEDDYAYIAEFATALCTNDDARVRHAGLTFLKYVPEKWREAVGDHGGTLGLVGMLQSDDPKVVKDALDVAELYKDPDTKLALMNVNASLPDDLKQRAADLLKAMQIPVPA